MNRLALPGVHQHEQVVVNLTQLRVLVGLPEKHTGMDDVAKPLHPNVHVFPFLPQVAFARKFMVNVHRVFPAGSQHWKLTRCSNNFHFALVAHGDIWVVLLSTQLSHHSIQNNNTNRQLLLLLQDAVVEEFCPTKGTQMI